MKKFYPLLGICLIFVFFIGGCAQYSLVKAGGKTNVGNTYSVAPQIDWSMSSSNDLVVWTVDGPFLEKVFFFPAIENGKPLLKAANDKKMPFFASTMTPIEIMDLVEATLARMKAQSIKKKNLKPAPFGKEEGFRFTFSYVSEDGLDYKGFAAGTVKDQKLYLVMYVGTDLCYFDKYVAEVEKVIDSIEII